MVMGLQFTKAQRRRIRELGALAYERELAAALTDLDGEFARWRAGEIDPFALEAAIHRFHQGPARKLYTKYGPSTPLDFVVAAAIHTGLISPEEAGPDMMEALGGFLAVYHHHTE